MTAPRAQLSEIAKYLVELEQAELQKIVAQRLLRVSDDKLPTLTREEDPADVFVDSDAWLRAEKHAWQALRLVCTELANSWADHPAVRERPNPLGELHYLCARVGALGASRGIARVVNREDLTGVLLSGGEGIQLRALRCLAGLLALASSREQKEFLVLFEKAMEVPQHLPIALTALVAFQPEDRARYVRRAFSLAPLREGEFLLHLDRNVELLNASTRTV